MARANVKTLLALDRFAAVLNIHPLHFNQIFLRGLPLQLDDSTARTCDVPVMQFSYQTAGRMGREDIAEAIAAAEALISHELGYLPGVDWTVDDQVATERPATPEYYNVSNLDIRGYWSTVKAQHGMIVSGGRLAKTLISAAVAIAYTDVDTDGYLERATITFATTITDPQEIAIYYPGHLGEDAWEIRPLKSVTFAAGVCTVIFAREQAIGEAAMMGYFPVGIDGVSGSFLASVDVYRKYNDPSLQSQFIWDTVGGGLCGCDGLTTCTVCGFTTQDGCLVARNPRLGIVSPQPGSWDSATSSFLSSESCMGRQADRVRLWYRSGWQNKSLAQPLITMDPLFERAIAYLALTFLTRPLCNCEPLESAFIHWREDLAQNISTPGESRSFNLARGALSNPFGTTRGAIYAWGVVSQRMLGRVAAI